MKKHTLKQSMRILVGIAIIIAMFYFFGLEESIDTLLSINPYWLILAYLVHATTWLNRTLRLRVFFNDQNIKDISLKDLFKINLSGYTLNLVLPFKLGDIARMYMFHTEAKAPLDKSIATVIYTRIFDILTLAIIGIISMILVFEQSTSDMTGYMILFTILTLAITALTSTRLQNMIAKLIEGKYPKIARIITSFRLTKKARIYALFYSALIWLADGITIDLVFKGLGQDVPIALVLLGLVVGNMVKSIPTTPGGIGLFEGTMAILFISFGINQSIAIVTSTVDHFVKNSTTLIFGIPALMSYDYDTETLKKWSGKIKDRLKNGYR